MGFGSYDESEQENHEIDTDAGADDEVGALDDSHDGDLSFDNGASNDELIDRLQDIK